MPSGQFNTVVISVSDILPLDKGHYISVSSVLQWPRRLHSPEAKRCLAVLRSESLPAVCCDRLFPCCGVMFLCNWMGGAEGLQPGIVLHRGGNLDFGTGNRISALVYNHHCCKTQVLSIFILQLLFFICNVEANFFEEAHHRCVPKCHIPAYFRNGVRRIY